MRSHQNRKATEVDFARETRRSNLRGIPSPKSERVTRTGIPATSLVTDCVGSGGVRSASSDLRHWRCPALYRYSGPPPAKPLRGNVTGFGLLFRRSEERLIETSFNGICSTLQE